MFAIFNYGGQNFGLRPWLVWNPTDLKNPNHSQVLIANLGIGTERMTDAQNSVYLDPVYGSRGEQPMLVVSSDISATIGSGPFLAQPSILSLKQISGNDPAKIDLIARYTEHFNKTYGTDLWQTQPFYIDPQYMNIQNLIWLAYFQ